MVIVFIKTNFQSKMMITTTVIPAGKPRGDWPLPLYKINFEILQFHCLNAGFVENHYFIDPVDNLVKRQSQKLFNIPFSIPNRKTATCLIWGWISFEV